MAENGTPHVENAYDLVYRVAREWGIFAAMVIFFIWSSWSREQELTARIERNESYMRDTIMVALNRNSDVISRFLARVDDDDFRNPRSFPAATPSPN